MKTETIGDHLEINIERCVASFKKTSLTLQHVLSKPHAKFDLTRLRLVDVQVKTFENKNVCAAR